MSKKSKRNRARKKNLNQRINISVAPGREQIPAYSLVAPKAATDSSEASKYKILSERYKYVLPELKVISVISGIIFLVLFLLSFLLR